RKVNQLSTDHFEVELIKDKNAPITILQVTDLHLGSTDEGKWRKDLITFQRIKKLVEMHNPDMIAITGDLFTGEKPFGSMLAIYIVNFFDSLERPWIYTIGNHDPEGGFGRAAIAEVFAISEWAVLGKHKVDNEWNEKYDYTVDLVVNGSEVPAWQIFAFDSGMQYQNPITVTNLTLLTMQAFSIDNTPSRIVVSQIGSQVFQPSQKINKKLEQGLLYAYYEGKFHHTKQLTKDKSVSSGVMARFSIDMTMIPENFGYIFEGYIEIPKDGLYTFNLESNDGSALFINDIKVIDNDGAHGANLVSVSTSLESGFHKIRVNYFQLGGGKLLNVSWQTKDFPKQNIPVDRLFH
ncbi:MAG: metallophosphoesterase, partial [Flavobacteriaceae bacterium]|nr:metallophosphoesterase [Flavobacteriaceae bacterium]